MPTPVPYVSAYTLLQSVKPSTIHWDSQQKFPVLQLPLGA